MQSSNTSPQSRRSLVEWLLAGLFLIALGGYIAYTLFQDYHRLDARERERLPQQAKTVSDNLAHQLNSINLALTGVLNEIPDWKKQKDGVKMAVQHIKALTGAMPSVITMFMLDANGTVIASDKPELIGQNFAHREYFQTVRRNPNPSTLYVSPPFMTALGRFTMNLSRMISGPGGSFDGMVVCALDPTEFKVLLESVIFRSDTRAALIHGDGVPFLMAPLRLNVASLDLVKPGALLSQHLQRGEQASLFVGPINDIDNERMVALRTIQPEALSMDKPLIIAVERGLPAIFANWRKDVLKSAIFFGTLALIVMLNMFLYQRRRRVSERIEAELEAARQRESEKYRTLLRASSDGIHVMDTQGNLVEVSDSFCRMLGYTQEEMQAMNVADWDVGVPKPELLGNIARLREAHVVVETQQRHRDGRLIDVEISATGVKLGDSHLVYAAARDVTERKKATAALAQFNRDFEAFLNQTTDFVYYKDRDRRFRFCSQPLAEMAGQAHWRDMVGKLDLEIFPAGAIWVCNDAELAIFCEGTAVLDKIDSYCDPNGRPRYVLTNKWPLFDDAGKVVGIFGIGRDITEQKHNEIRLQLAASVFTHAREGITITDTVGNILEVNDSFTRITGYNREEVLSQNPRILKSGRHDEKFYEAMWRSLVEKGYWSGELWNRRKNGEVYVEMVTITAVRDAAGVTQNYVALFSDITPMKEQQEQLERIAHYDALTNLPNRVLLADRLHQAIAQSQRREKRLAVVYLDLDGFKAINDRHGHAVGDELLIAISQRMKATLREGDTLARIGGDEFVAVLIDLEHPQDCEPMLERLLQAAATPVASGTAVLQVSASLGVTTYPEDKSDADRLLRHADQAMYQAKQAGKNRYHLFDGAAYASGARHNDARTEDR